MLTRSKIIFITLIVITIVIFVLFDFNLIMTNSLFITSPFLPPKVNVAIKVLSNIDENFINFARSQKFSVSNIWPEDDSSDRILQQLAFVPSYSNNQSTKITMKSILLWDGFREYPFKNYALLSGQKIFHYFHCPVYQCRITINRSESNTADMIFFSNKFKDPKIKNRRENQIWMFHTRENPIRFPLNSSSKVNWTSTYSKYSDIPNLYGKFIYYSHPNNFSSSVNYAYGKTKLVAWAVSNCYAINNRLQYAKELGNHIQVDIYGQCGTLKCERKNTEACLKKFMKEYKFYLAFENTNCREYITEKFFKTALSYRMVPIVMGAPIEDYKRIAPEHSFIHVDEFDTPADLASYLLKLHSNDTLYNEYFRWKDLGEIVLNDRFFCRLCSVLHAPHSVKQFNPENSPVHNKKCCTRKKTWRGVDLSTCDKDFTISAYSKSI